jgi:hypothetical protein
MGNYFFGQANTEIAEKPVDPNVKDKTVMICNRTNKKQRWIINDQQIECDKNTDVHVYARKDMGVKVENDSCSWNFIHQQSRFYGEDNKSYHFGYETNNDQTIVYITRAWINVKIANQSNSNLTIHHILDRKRVHANLPGKSFGKYYSADLKVFTSMGTPVPIRNETKLGFFNVTETRTFDNIVITYSETDDKFVIHDSIF